MGTEKRAADPTLLHHGLSKGAVTDCFQSQRKSNLFLNQKSHPLGTTRHPSIQTPLETSGTQASGQPKPRQKAPVTGVFLTLFPVLSRPSCSLSLPPSLSLPHTHTHTNFPSSLPFSSTGDYHSLPAHHAFGGHVTAIPSSGYAAATTWKVSIRPAAFYFPFALFASHGTPLLQTLRPAYGVTCIGLPYYLSRLRTHPYLPIYLPSFISPPRLPINRIDHLHQLPLHLRSCSNS